MWKLCGHTEVVVVQSIEVGTVTNQDAVFMYQIVFQVLSGCILQFAEHIVGFCFKNAQSFYIAQIRV